MKNALRWMVPCLIAFFLLQSSGCDNAKNPTESNGIDSLAAATKAQQAYTEMENQMYFLANNTFNSAGDFDRLDFSPANTLYREALQADPNNAAANFGAALSEIFLVYADPVVNDAVKRWEGADLGKGERSSLLRFGIPTGTKDMTIPSGVLARNLAKIIRTAVTDPPMISEMQTILRDRFLPRLNDALARLTIVEQFPSFELRISGKMQGNTTLAPVYLDLTEVYLVDALVRGMKAMVEQFLVFRFELAVYTTKAAVDAIRQDNTSFFVLASDGATRSLSVKTDLLTMIGKIRDAVNFLKNETDSQSDDIIKLGPSGVASSDLDTVLTYLTKAEDALNGPMTVDLREADTDLNNYTIQVNLNQFFTNPPTNPKQQWLPTYSVDTTDRGDIMWHWQAQDYASFNFPDPTFGGLFPGMTNETMKRILYLDEAFGWQLDCWVGMYNYMNQLPTATTAWLMINGTQYFPKPDPYGYASTWSKYFRFLVTNNDGRDAQLVVAFSGVTVPMQMSRAMTVRLKSRDYLDAYMDPAPQNVTGQAQTDYYSSQPYVSLNFNQYGTFIIEKDSTGSGYFRLDSLYLYSTYSDFAVSHGSTYHYRAQYLPFYPYFWSYGIMAWRANNYTNTVAVSIP